MIAPRRLNLVGPSSVTVRPSEAIRHVQAASSARAEMAMHRSHNYLAGLTARRADGQTVQITLVRIDPASNRMTFEELALVMADPNDPLEIAQAMVIGASKLVERATPPRPPAK